MSVPEGSKIILRTEVGSRVHGIAVKGTDDRDEMEIVVPPTWHVCWLSASSHPACPARPRTDSGRNLVVSTWCHTRSGSTADWP